MKRPDLLLMVAIWAFFSAFLYVVGVVAIATFSLPEAVNPDYGPTEVGSIVGQSIAILVLLCCAGLSLAAGVGILKAESWGRILGIVVAVLSLFWIPIGTVLGVLILIYLAKSEIRAYFEDSS